MAQTTEPSESAGLVRQQRGSSGDSSSIHVVTAYVVEPGGPCNRYRWDADTGGPVLDGVLHPSAERGVDLARVPLLPMLLRRAPDNTHRRRASWIEPLSEDRAGELIARLGPGLVALVVARPPNPPGTRLSVRLLGAVPVTQAAADAARHANPLDDLSQWIALAVPTADPTLTHVERVSDLPDTLRVPLVHALIGIVPTGSGFAQRPDTWLAANRVMATYREARARGRLSARAADLAERDQGRERLFATSSDGEGSESFRRWLARDASPQAQAQPSEPTSAWREIAPINPAELRARGAAVFGEADQLARWVPTRFARYLGDLLQPDERVLFFAECPPLTIRGWSGVVESLSHHSPGTQRIQQSSWSAVRRLSQAFEHLRPHHLRAGILLVTDRQVLLLRDYAAPDATMVQWGYSAQSWPLGRLVAVRTLPPGMALDENAVIPWPVSVRDRLAGAALYDEATAPCRYVRLMMAMEGATGIQVVGAAFPSEAVVALERAADLLQRFLPRPGVADGGDRRVRLLPAVAAWRPTEQETTELKSLGGLVAPAVSEALGTAAVNALRPGEVILAQARTPRTSEVGPEKAALLTLTPERLLIATSGPYSGSGEALPPAMRELPLATVTSATLQHSLLGCAISVSLPDGDTVDVRRLTIGFPSPIIVPFRALYTRLRLLIGGPIISADVR